MKTLFIYISLFCIIPASGFAQNIDNYIEKQKPVDFQKLYIHTDREFFFEGDTLWFAAYLLEGQTHVLDSGKCNLYVEIIDGKGVIVKQDIFILIGGAAAGNVVLSKTKITKGKYMLRAYTDYLKNFGEDAFYTKNIKVSSVKSSFDFSSPETETSKQLSTTKNATEDSVGAGEIDIRFMPEGGFLLAGQSNCVAFKAINKQGKGVPVKGKVVDQQNQEILTFQSVYKGAGKFFIVPSSDTEYRVIISSNKNLSYRLPAVQTSGAKLKLLTQTWQNLQMLIQVKGDVQFPMHLVTFHRGRVGSFMNIEQKDVNKPIRLKSEILGVGINRMVLLDNRMNPVSERLVFNTNFQFNSLAVEVGDESYSTRESIQLHISPSEEISEEAALLSVAVVDENYVSAEKGKGNIASYLLLNSELKGNIESPTSYFVDENISALVKLDLLMCTNGWSNYKWNTLLSNHIELKFPSQLGFNFTGKVKQAVGKKGVKDGNVFFMVKSPQTTQVLDVPLNSNGTFSFEEVIFFDSAAVLVQGRNKRNKHTINLDLEFPELVSPAVGNMLVKSIAFNDNIPVSVYRQRYLNEMKLREFYPDRNTILMEDIEVTGKKYLENWKTGPVFLGDGTFLLTKEEIAGSADIVQYLLDNVPGVYPTRGNQGISLSPPGSGFNIKTERRGDTGFQSENTIGFPIEDKPILGYEPVFWIDYSLMLTVDDVRQYPVEIFETIELYDAPMSYFYRAPGGVILLTTKKGRGLEERRTDLFGGELKTIRGFTKVREFYSPKYTAANLNSNVPDFRNTLYWNPRVILRGEKELHFNACDNTSRYKVIVEGITESGKICIGEADFEVITE